MPKNKKIERSANYSYYSDLLWCTVPLIGMSWYFYGLRPVLLLLVGACNLAYQKAHRRGNKKAV